MINSVIVSNKDFGVHEECGIFGIIQNEKQPLAKEVYYGLFALQHRGQESAGIAVNVDGNKVAYYKNMGLVSEVFTESDLALMPDTNIGIGHVRYSTKGSSNVVNAQPVVFYGRFGRMAIAENGNITNANALKNWLIDRGHIFQSSVDSELVAALFNYYISGDDIASGIQKACMDFVGAYAIVTMANNKLFAVRDRHGLKPLIMGKKGNAIVFASESCALDAVDATIIRDVEPGEIVIVSPDGTIESRFMQGSDKHPCVFEYVYLARSDSVIDDVSVYQARYNCGMELAKLFKIDADIVAGVPDSATVCARGYADVSGLPMVDALTKNRYVGRSFIQPTQALRESAVKIKLNAFRSNIKGKRLILIDDSIVRGTTSKKIINLLRANGATEVHMVVGSPPVKHPCYFGVDMETPDQLIAAYKTEDEICKEIGADSLHYIPLDLLVKSCGGNNFCAACFDGNYPMDISNLDLNED
ncbi:MAG: amidophosphoribosyltransferase [Clostridia bacterium]